MSLLSNKRVHMVLQPGAMRASLWRGRFRPTRIAAQARDADIDGVGALLQALAQQAPIAGASLHVAVADALVHFDVAAGDFGSQSARQLRTLASACATDLLGERAHDHALRWQLQRDERHLVICAIPNPVISALTVAAAAHKLRLTSISPNFSAQWNRHAHRPLPDNAVFAVSSGVNAMIACVRRGIITAMSNGPWCAGAQAEGHRPYPASTGPEHRKSSGNANLGALDIHVDRLLAGLGFDSGDRSAYLLVTDADARSSLSRRWKVLSPIEAPK